MTYTKLDSTGKICYVWGSNIDGSNPFGNNVSQLKNEHYLNNSNITTVYLLDSPTEYKIEQRAFQNCANLQIIKTVDQTMEIHPLYGNDSQILYNVSEFDWNCFDNIGSAINFEYQNLNMDRIVFWGQCFYKNKTFNNFKINTNKDKCSIIFSTQMFAGYKKTFDTIEIVAKSLQYEQMATLPTYLDSLIYLAEIENKLKLDINITNLNDIKEFINNKIFTNRATYGTNTPIIMEFSFPNSLMYGVCDTDYASLPCYSTTERLKFLPGWTNIEIDNINPNIKKSALQLIDLSELNNEQVNLDKYYLSKCIQSNIELTILLPSLQFYLNNVTPIQPVYKWSNLRLLVPNESGTGGFIAFDTISLDNKINIHDYAFYNCQQLINIIISSQVMSIGKGAFYGCVNVSNLKYDAINCKSFNIQSGNQIFAKLGQDTDNGCLVQIGPNVEKIPTAFMYPEALDIHNPNLGIYPKIQDIQICDENWEALSGNNKNTKLTTISTAAFKYVNRSEWPTNNWNLTTFFQHCNNLKILGSSAFAGVHSIAELYLPDNLVEIGDNCFNDCINLNTIKNTQFPRTLTNMHWRAFGEWWDSGNNGQTELNKKTYRYKDNQNDDINGFDIDTIKPSTACPLLKYSKDQQLKDKVSGEGCYGFYIETSKNQNSNSERWLLHYRWALWYQSNQDRGWYSYIPYYDNNDQSFIVHGIGEHYLDGALYCRINTENTDDVYVLFPQNRVPKVIDAYAFNQIKFITLQAKPLKNIQIDIVSPIKIANQVFNLNIPQDTSVVYNVAFGVDTSNMIHRNAFSLKDNCTLSFSTIADFQRWIFLNKNNDNELISQDNTNFDNIIIGKGIWNLKVVGNQVGGLILCVGEQEEFSFGGGETPVLTIQLQKVQNMKQYQLSPYTLFNANLLYYQIDLDYYDLGNSYLFGNLTCFIQNDNSLFPVTIILQNGINNQNRNKSHQENQIFIPSQDRQILNVETLILPHYALGVWFKNSIQVSKNLSHYEIYGGYNNDSYLGDNSIVKSKLRIYTSTLGELSVPLSNKTRPMEFWLNPYDSLDETTWAYRFTNLTDMKYDVPVNYQHKRYWIGTNNLYVAPNLRYLYIHSAVTDIGDNAFSQSSHLQKVKYFNIESDLTLQNWYNITFTSITSSPFYSIEWNDDKDNCKLYINDTEQYLPIVEIGEKKNYVIQNNNDFKYIKYDPKPFYNYPIKGLIFQECFKGEFQDKDLIKTPIQPLDITNTLETIQFNKMPANEYSVLKNIFRAKTETINEIIGIKYPTLTKILLDNSIINLPAGCFANLLNDDKKYNNYFSNIEIGLSNQLEILGENSFYNCNCYVGEYDENKEVVSAQFNQLKLANSTGLGMGLITNTLYTDGANNATYYNQATGFLLKCEPELGDAIDLSNMKIIDLKAIKYETASSINLTIPWLGTCGDAEYVPADQYSALKNWFDITDAQTINIDTLHIKNPNGLHGFNPIGTTIPVFQNININNLVIEAPNSKPIATNQQHFDSKNMNLNSIILKMNEIPSYLLSNNENDLQQINKLHIQPYTANNLSIVICDKALRTPIINEIIFMSQENLCGNSVFNDQLINDYVYYSAPLKDWVRYNSFGNENSNPIRFARKFYTNYINEENKGGIERVLQPDSDEYNDGTNAWRRFYVNSYSLYNNHQVNTIICTHNNAKQNELYRLYDPSTATTFPITPFRSYALIEVIADNDHNAIYGLTKDNEEVEGDIYAKQCFKVGVIASEAIPKEEA